MKGERKSENGFNYWVSGYDYNSTGGVGVGFQGNFVNNGLITPDRAWTGKLTEVKRVYQNAAFTDFYDGKLTLKNKNSFVSLEGYNLVYQVLRDGRVVEEGTADMPAIAAGKEAKVAIPYTTNVGDDAEYLLNVSLRLKEATMWAEEGYAVAEQQFEIGKRPALAAHNADMNSCSALTIEGQTVKGKTADANSPSASTTARCRHGHTTARRSSPRVPTSTATARWTTTATSARRSATLPASA